MLLEFSVKNYRSIRELASLNMIASKRSELEEENTFPVHTVESSKILRVLKSAVIFGPNASGKSNLLKAIQAMKIIIVGNGIKKLPIVPFLFDKSCGSSPTEFEINFIVGDVRYCYGFSATSDQVFSEYLYAFPKGRAQKWFERYIDDQGGTKYDFGSHLLGTKDIWAKNTRENALFLTTAVFLNSQQLKPIYDWFSEKLVVFPSPVHNWDSLAKAGREDIDYILEFLRQADFAITDLKVTEKAMDFRLLDSIPEPVRDYFTSQFKQHKHVELRSGHKVNGGDTVYLDFHTDESTGTHRMLSYAIVWIDALRSGKVILIDELNNNLHPRLVHYLVSLFHGDANSSFAQLVFTTHETSVLDQNLFRRDQVWFVDREQDQSSVLDSLSAYSPRKGVENIERSYLSGRYGALPVIRPWGSFYKRINKGAEE